MAERTIRQLIDDIDASDITEDGETVEFSLRGVSYRIDLSKVNSAKLDKALKPFVEAATPVRRLAARRARGLKSLPTSSKQGLLEIRQWAREHGYEVSDRGRIKADIVRAFEAAHSVSPS